MMHRNKQKKGISTVIAAIFMVAIIVVGLNVMTWGLNLQNNFGQAVTERNTAETEQSSEKIELRNVKIDSNKFNMTVVNTGEIPVKLVKMWVTNSTCTTATCTTANWHPNYTLNDLINPGDSLTKLGTNLGLFAKSSASYKVNLITERGTSANFQILSPKDKAVKMNLFALPDTLSTKFNVTLLFSVTNNMTDGSILQSITPQLKPLTISDYTYTDLSPPTATVMEGPTPVSEPSLSLAQTAFFKWIIKVEGDPGETIRFNATVANAKAGNYVTAKAKVALVAFAEQSSIALSSEGISISANDAAGILHLHNEQTDVPNLGYQLQSTLPDVTATTTLSFSSGVSKFWLTKNSTAPVTIAAGNWKITLWLKNFNPNTGNTVLRVNFTITNNSDTTVPGSYPKNIPGGQIDFNPAFQTTSYINNTQLLNLAQVDLATQERLKMRISHFSGSGIDLRFDESNFDSLVDPPGSPVFPQYQTYSGGVVKVIVKNSGPQPIWIDRLSRVVFTHTGNLKNYAGIITNWENVTSSESGAIGGSDDSKKLPIGTQLRLVFTEACVIPSTSACATANKASQNPGNYDVFVRISGYDKGGGFVLRVVQIGVVIV